ncbi:choice-of-anchor L domain-containing protein, partial [Flavobacterium aurantiibacter]
MKKLLQLLLFFGFIQVAVGQQADVVVSVTNNQIVYVPGTELIYTITVSNFGPNTANGVEVISPLPAGITEGYYWEGSNNTSGSNSQLFDRIRTLTSGQTVTYTLFIDVPLTYSGPLTVAATANSIGAPALTAPPSPALPAVADPNSNSNLASDTDQQSSSDIALTFTNNTTYYFPGQVSTYIATVTNLGPTPALNVSIFCDIPSTIPDANFTWTGSNGSSGTGTALSDNLGNLAVGETVTYTLNIAVPTDFQVLLQLNCSVFSTSTDANLTNNNVTQFDVKAQGADITVTNSDNSDTYIAGSSSTYTVVVQNLGPDVATNVDVTFPLPVGITSMSWAGNATGGTGALSNTIPSLAVGANVTYTVTIDVPIGFTGSLIAVANASGVETDLNSQCDGCTDINTSGADLVTTITNNQTTFAGGSQTTYTVAVTNNGPQTAENVSVIQTLSAGADVISWSATNGTAGADLLDLVIPALAAGETVTFTINVSVSNTAVSPLVSTVNVDSDTFDPNPNCSTCTDSDTKRSGDVSVSITNNATEYVRGTTTQGVYQITVTNNSSEIVNGVTITNPSPSGLTTYVWTSSIGTSGTGGITQTIPSIGPGQSVVYTINYTVSPSFTANLVSTVTVVSQGLTDSSTANNVAVDTDVPLLTADLQMTISNGQTIYVAPSTLVYTVVVRNNGPTPATNINVSIPALSGGAAITSWTGNAATGDTSVTNTISNLAVGATVTYTLNVTVPAGFAGDLTVAGTVTGSSGDLFPSNNAGLDVDVISNPQADVTVSISDNTTTYTPGTIQTYTVAVTNNGPQSAAAVNVSIPIPAGVTTVTWVGNGTNGTGAINNNITSLAAGETVIYTYNVTVPITANAAIVVTPTITFAADSDTSNNTVSDTNSPPSSDVLITVTPPTPAPTKGTQATFVVTVTNNGPRVATNVQISNANPVGAAIISYTSNNGLSGSGPLNLTIPSLGVGASVIFTVVVDIPVNFSGTLNNTASVSSTTADLNLANNSATGSTVPVNSTVANDISVTISNAVTTYIAGQTSIYTITVRNLGTASASNVSVNSSLPADITSATWTGNSTSGNGSLVDVISSLPAGSAVQYTVTVNIPASFPQTANLVYTVNAIFPSDTNTSNNQATDVDSPRPFADLSVLKTDNKTTYAETRFVDDKIGDTVPGFTIEEFNEYVVTVINNGPSDAVNVSVIDLLPSNPIATNTAIVPSDMTWVGPNGTSGTGTMISNLPSLAAGATVTYTIRVRVPANYNIGSNSNFTNTASVASDTPDGNIANNLSTDVNTPASRFILVENDPAKYSVNGQLSGLAEGFVQNVLVRSNCAETSNWQLSSGPNPLNYSVGYFNRRNSDFPIQDGIVLVCGNAMDPNGAAGPNAAIVDGGNWAGDTDFNPGFMVPPVGIPANTTNDAAFLKFNFVPSTDKLKFNFVFASEEYSQNNFECTYSDVFAFILTDLTAGGQPKNLAVIPNTNIPVKVTTIHLPGCDGGQNPQWFGKYNFNNADATVAANAAINFNGQTRIMQAQGDVIPGHQYSIKLVIANQGDAALASAVFIEGGSFDFESEISGAAPFDDVTEFEGGNAVCDEEIRTIQIGSAPLPNATYSWLLNGVKIDGENQFQLQVSENGVYTAVITFATGCKKTDDIIVNFTDPIPTADPENITLINPLTPTVTFNINQTLQVLNGFSSALYEVSYHPDQQSAMDFANNINEAVPFVVNIEDLPLTLWMRIGDLNSTAFCSKYRPFVLDVFNPTGTISYDVSTGCSAPGVIGTPTQSPDLELGGTYFATPSGLAIDPVTGVIDYEASTPSNTPYSVAYTIQVSDDISYTTPIVQITVENCCITTLPTDFPVCYSNPITITATSDKPAATFNWTGPNGFTATGTTITDSAVLPAGTYTYTATANDNGIDCDSDSIVITVLPEVTAQIVPNNFTVCSGSNTAVQFQGLAGATITYNINGGADQTAVLDATGFFQVVFTNVTTPFTVNLTKVELISSIVCSLLGTPILDTVTVSTGAPTATIGSPNPICEGSNATVPVSATPNTIVNFEYQNLSGTQNGSIPIDGSGQGLITLNNLTSITTVNLLSVTTSDTPPCTATITGQSAVV